MDSTQDVHFVLVPGVSGTTAGSPIADFNSGGTVTDVVCMSKYHTAYFMIFWGVGTTGTTTITAIPTDDVLHTNHATAIPFLSKKCSSTDTNTAWAASSSLLTTTGSHQMTIVKVCADDLPIGYEYVMLNLAETAASALLGGCIIMMADPRYAEDTTDSVIT